MNNLRYKINDNDVAISKNNSIKELCAESPFLVINTDGEDLKNDISGLPIMCSSWAPIAMSWIIPEDIYINKRFKLYVRDALK